MREIGKSDLHLLNTNAPCLVSVEVCTTNEITWKCVQLLDEASKQNVMHFNVIFSLEHLLQKQY